MRQAANIWLTLAGLGSALAALLHIACMLGGPDWFRFFGAGEAVARAVERGRAVPYFLTSGIAAVLCLWAAYAFSGAGLIARLPLLRLGLIAITAVCLARGAAVFFPSFWLPEHSPIFRIVSSLIVGGLGGIFLLGTIKAWPTLSGRV